jgi:hypothetical protein
MGADGKISVVMELTFIQSATHYLTLMCKIFFIYFYLLIFADKFKHSIEDSTIDSNWLLCLTIYVT